MKAIGYYLVRGLLYAISRLPFWIMYRLSSLVFFVVYYIIGYRKEVVRNNLKNSFPDKPEEELKQIEINFFKYLFDLMLESIKTLTISRYQLEKRVQFNSTEIFEKYSKKNQSIILVMGHLGNWELGGARFALEPYHQLMVVYHPIKDKRFDKLVFHMRTRLGNGLYAMNNTLRGMIADRKKLTATAFIADQTPSPKGAYWIDFLNQDTPFFVGTGKIANKFNYPVVYVSIKREKRGYYVVYLDELCKSPKDASPEEIVNMFSKRLEKDITENPEIWLWSHKRWKHKRSSISE